MTDGYHFSEISTWLKCQQSHKYSYRDRLTLRVEESQISFGTYGHEVLASLLVGNTKDAAREHLEDYAKEKTGEQQYYEQVALRSEAYAVACNAYDFLSQRFEVVDFAGKPLVEVPLKTEVEYKGRIIPFVGTPDCILRDKVDGGNWVFDHKFRKSFRPNWAEDLNLQMVFYQYMLRHQYGIETVGTRQFQIKPFLPKRPKLTSKGKMSEADCFTTWEIYAEECTKNGLNPDDYREAMFPKLYGKVFFDYDSNRALRSVEEVDAMWEQTILPAAYQIDNNQDPIRCFNHFSCKMCSFREYCVEDMKGGDLIYLQKSRYKKKGETSFFDVELLEDEEE